MNGRTDSAAELQQDRRSDEQHRDGNALGGLLGEIFGRDVTGGRATCGTCGAENGVGALIAYNRPPDSVLRCPGCSAVLMVVVEHRDGFRVTFEGLRSLDLAGGESS
jgi:hypothetical protein